jgi:hypothetical protein
MFSHITASFASNAFATVAGNALSNPPLRFKYVSSTSFSAAHATHFPATTAA